MCCLHNHRYYWILCIFSYEAYLDYAGGKFALVFWDLLGNAVAVLGFGIFAGIFAGTIAAVIIAIVCNIVLYAWKAIRATFNYNIVIKVAP